MEKMKTAPIFAVLEVRVPQMTPLKTLGLGLAGSKILTNFDVLESAELLTWWVEDVTVCNSTYINCPQCGKIAMVCRDAVVLDGKPLCIHCSANFQHGDLPTPRTPEDIKKQLGGGF